MTSLRDQPLTGQQLVAQAIQSCDEVEERPSELAYNLFVAHQWIMDNTQLLALFLALFQESRDVEHRRRVCVAVAMWIRLFPMHFEGQPQLCSLVVRLKTIAEDAPAPIRDALDVTNLPSTAWMRALSMRNRVVRQGSLSFDQWSPEDISTSLSHIDFRVLSKITIDELKKYVKHGHLDQTPVLERSISVFNNLSNWVQCMILSKATPQERADMITKFVIVGKLLRQVNNFNTMMAVIGGVTHSNISRLSKTHPLVHPNIKKDLNKLTSLLSMQNNFGEYRNALDDCGSRFKVPIVGVHLKDLIALSCVGQDYDKTKTITQRKLGRIANVLTHFLVFQRYPHGFPDPNFDLINTLRVSLDIRYNEDDIYELSQRREPRTFISAFESSRQVVFADWASGVSAAPDPDTVNKHVSAMVEAVFKHYDHDRDGYISRAEFRQVVGNFPFIDPFGAIDVDRDGQISKEELKAYFVKANQDSVALRSEFKHNFHETTFLTPTTCSHCGKVLWGLIRQGWKCKDCGVSVHGYCKQNAVVECHRRSTSSSSNSVLGEWLSLRHNPSFRERLLIHYKRGPRFRSVSTVSSSPKEADNGVVDASEDHSGTTSNPPTSRSNRLQLPLRHNRPQSETVDFYSNNTHGMSPDDEPLASLACEEVFEDDSSGHLDTAAS